MDVITFQKFQSKPTPGAKYRQCPREKTSVHAIPEFSQSPYILLELRTSKLVFQSQRIYLRVRSRVTGIRKQLPVKVWVEWGN
jgi:hypothetical protein